MPPSAIITALSVHSKRFKGLLWFSVIAIFFYAYWESNAPERERARLQEERDKIGFDASAAGSTWASATRACRRIGVPNVYTCAEHKGPLVADMSASAIAVIAVSLRKDYDSICQKHFEQAYCYSLLNRAYQIALNTPEQ